MFERVAPIFPVRDLDRALAFYARLGFGVRRYAGGGYGYVARDGVELHLGEVVDLDHHRAWRICMSWTPVLWRPPGGRPARKSTDRRTRRGANTRAPWSTPMATSSGSAPRSQRHERPVRDGAG